jgi:hypothetical protein
MTGLSRARRRRRQIADSPSSPQAAESSPIAWKFAFPPQDLNQRISPKKLRRFALLPLLHSDLSSHLRLGLGKTSILRSATKNLTNCALTVDSVQVFQVPPQDAGVTSITNVPLSAALNQPITIRANVRNFGSQTISNVPVFYIINNGTPVGPVTIPGPIAPLDSASADFGGEFQFTPNGGAASTPFAPIHNCSGDGCCSKRHGALYLLSSIRPHPLGAKASKARLSRRSAGLFTTSMAARNSGFVSLLRQFSARLLPL